MSLERITEKIGREDNFLGRITSFITRKTSAYAAAFSVAATALVGYAGCASDMADSGGYEEFHDACIAFVYAGNIHVMDGNGKNEKQLTRTGWDGHQVTMYRSHISPSPDGKRIAFNDGKMDIYIIDVDGSNERKLSDDKNPLTFSSGSDDIFPVWSPDGKYLAFIAAEDDKGTLYVTDGFEKRALVDDIHGQPVFVLDRENEVYVYDRPAWSPDGKKLAYSTNTPTYIGGVNGGVNNVGDRLGIMVVDIDGSNRKKVTNNQDGAECSEHPAWMPDGSGIYFNSVSDDGTYDIYFVNLLDGSQEKRVTEGMFPIPNPTGFKSEIAFLSNRRPFYELFVDDEDSEPRRMSYTKKGIDVNYIDPVTPSRPSFSWSPSGKAIVASAGEWMNIIKVDDGTQKELGANSHLWFDAEPVWLPSCVEDRYWWMH